MSVPTCSVRLRENATLVLHTRIAKMPSQVFMAPFPQSRRNTNREEDNVA